MSNTENSTITADQNTAGTVNSQRPKDYRTKINVRKGHRSWVTRTINNANDALIHFSDDMRVDLDGWKLVLTDKLGVLEKYDEEIMSYMSDEDEIEKEIFDSSQVRGDMQKMILRIETKLGTSCSVNDVTVSTSSRTARSAKLPKLTLKSFGGNVIEFQSFWDNFKAAVHDNNTLEKITKFNYLKSYLYGTALSTISGLSLTGDNYDEAVKMIEDRFGNKQVLINTNVEKLISLSTVNSSHNVEALRDNFNKIETFTRNLKSLNVGKEKYGPFLASIVMSKFPNDINLIVSRSMPVNEEWEIEELLQCLKRELESREMCYNMRGGGGGG